MDEEMKVVAEFNTQAEADLLRVRLENEGIEGVSADNKTLAAWGFTWATGSIKVLVKAADVDRAMAVIGERDADRAKRKEAAEGTQRFTCDKCGETISFPRSKAGTVQSCPECFAYVDVPEE